MLSEEQALILQCWQFTRSSNSLLLELLAILGPCVVVWIPNLLDFDTGVFKEQLDDLSSTQSAKIEVVVNGGVGSRHD